MSDTITQVSLIAGEIWHFVKEFTLMSLGSLAGEGGVSLEEKDNDFKLTRKKWKVYFIKIHKKGGGR